LTRGGQRETPTAKRWGVGLSSCVSHSVENRYSEFRLDEVHGEPPSPHLAQRPGGHNLGGSRVDLSRQKSRGLKLRKTVSH
jgi:hypothetical protein